MITNLHLNNFKCFEDLDLPIGQLTLLTGINGTGKSTIIQALALLRQSITGHNKISGLVLNGPLVSLGTAEDVLYEFALKDELSIGYKEGNTIYNWLFSAKNRDEDVLPLLNTTSLKNEGLLFERSILHLGAERLGPRILHPMSAHTVRTEDSMLSDGSFAVAWLDENQRLEVEPALRHPESPSPVLREQVVSWMREISPGLIISVSAHRELQRAEIRFGFEGEASNTRNYRPTGVGFGLSYTLPVILSCLAAKDGRILMIENPEAHLHPRGQMALGILLARAASAGGQVFVETHSDHVLNGVRLAVKREVLAPNDVSIHYFKRKSDKFAIKHTCHSPKLDKQGKLSEWPDGFFDQFDIALEELL